jgi:hypothetical protein
VSHHTGSEQIGHGSPETFFVPPYTSADAAIPGMTFSPVDPADLATALDGIARSLGIYPPGLLRGSARRFSCVDTCGDGVGAGGTYGPQWIILSAPRDLPGEAILRLAEVGVHHECSALVRKGQARLQAKWLSLLAPGSAPVATLQDALMAAASGSDRLPEGFLTPYGATDAENDFNVYAETALAEPARPVEMAREFPLVARKSSVLLGAYTDRDPRMRGVFEQFGLGHLIEASALPQLEFGMPPPQIPPGEIAR